MISAGVKGFTVTGPHGVVGDTRNNLFDHLMNANNTEEQRGWRQGRQPLYAYKSKRASDFDHSLEQDKNLGHAHISSEQPMHDLEITVL